MSNLRLQEKNNQNFNHITRIFLSVIAGGVVGVTAALLLAPKSGKKLRKNFLDTYEDLSGRGREFINDAVDKGRHVAASAADFAENIKESAEEFAGYASVTTNPNMNLLIGALGGGILGAVTVLLMTSKEEKSSLSKKIQEIDWMDTAKELLSTLHHKSNRQPYRSETQAESKEHNKVQDVLELANLGIRLWENLKKGS